MGVSFNNRVSFRLYLYLTILLHLIPLPDILILLAEIFHLFAIAVQINVVACKVHRVDDGILDDTRFQALVQENILYGQRHLPILRALHQ